MKEMPYELPKASEKLSYKFILDALKEEVLASPAKEEAAKSLSAEDSLQEELTKTSTSAECMLEDVSTCGTEAPLSLSPEEAAHESIPMDELQLPAGKKYFRIKEVSQLIGVEPYVLRYWESEFSAVKPAKSGSGHRVYSRRDVEALHLIRHLLHVEKFSIKGAKKKVLERRRQAQMRPAAVPVQLVQKQTLFLKDLVGHLKELIHAVQTNPGTI